MAANVNKWSETPASNATADPAINWAEGQAPSTVNDSARQMMAAIAADRDDTRGSLTFGGTSAALTLATNSVNATYQNGMRVSGKLASAFTTNATLNVDSVGAKNIYRYNNGGASQVQAADGFTGQHVTFEYEAALNSSAGGWVLIGEPIGRVVGIQVLTSTGTYTKNPAASTGDLYVIGGGGGGGGAAVTGAGQAAIGSGGAAGGLTIAYNAALSAFTGLTATIGAAGTVGAGATGGTGGTTTLGTLSATGGNGGTPTGAFSSAGSVFMAGGGSPGGGSGGTLNLVGHVGGIAFFLNTTPLSGSGAPSPLFGGGGVFSGSGTGGPGSGPGSGGGGAINGASAAAKAGALGAPGMIIIVERA